ncbi:MAG TPA: DeoR/GlpR family DNA-binding transcription regulator [Marmoricola sp.]|nr:DeoR/GlpR family DNA-binding transcription regulator [Marmoricola sp.]
MYAEERQRAIAELVLRRGRMAVTELSEDFEVTTETIRRDLSALERSGVLRRVHGGAVPAGGMIETVLSERDVEHAEEKDRIAKLAVEQLGPRDSTLLLDAGSSTARLAGLLPRDRTLTVFTHAVPIAFRLGSYTNVELHMLPGRIRPATQAAVGTDTVTALAHLRVDVAFVGTNGLSLRHGLSTPDVEEAAAKRALIDAAQRVILLADHTKIGREFTVRFAPLDRIDLLITDSQTPRRVVKELQNSGLEVAIA